MPTVFFRAFNFNLLYVLALTLLVVGCGGSAALNTPEELGRHLAKTLVTKNFSQFAERVVNENDFVHIVQTQNQWYAAKKKTSDISRFTDEKMESFRKAFPKKRVEKLAEFQPRFNLLISELEKAKLNVSQLKFEGVSQEKMRNRRGVDELDLYITLSHGNSKIVIQAPGCIKTTRGWIYTEAPKLDSNTPVNPG